MVSERQQLTVGELLSRYGGSIKTGPFGTVLKASEYTNSGTPVISVREIQKGGFRVDERTPRLSPATVERLPEYLLGTGDIVFARKGSVERCALVGEAENGWFLGSDGIRLRPPETVDSRFLAYWMQSPQLTAWLQQHSTGSTMPSLNADILSRVPLSLPSLDEQRSVADILATLDNRVTLLDDMNTTLRSIAQAMFTSWFIDFDPVHAKTVGQDPEGMDAETAALFPSEFEESDLGPIPTGWCAKTLADVAHLNLESWSTKSHPETVLYIDLSNVKEDRIDQIAEYAFADAPTRARRILKAGDTIVGTVRPGNRSYAFIHAAPAKLTGSTGFAVLTPKQDAYAEYIYLAATRSENIERLANLADGGAYPAVRPELVQQTPAVVPPIRVLEAFSTVVAPLFSQMGANRAMEATLTELRDTLLPRLISGKLRIPEAQAAVEEAALL